MSKGLRKQNNYRVPHRNNNPSASSSLEITQEMSFSTHLPPPEVIKSYNQIIPNFGIDVHNEFLENLKSNREFNKEILQTNKDIIRAGIISRYLGQIFAFVLAIIIFVIAWDLGTKGHDALAGVIATADIAGLVSVFFGVQHYSKKKQKAELPQSDEENPSALNQ